MDLDPTKRRVVTFVFLAACLFRIYPLLTSTYIWDEEREWIVVAERISLSPGSLYLPVHEGHHPSLPAYFMKAGAGLLGANPAGYRFFSLMAGLATLGILWRLALRWVGSAAALWPVLVLAFNEYHIGISILAVEKSFQHLFVAASLYGCYRYLAEDRAGFLYLSAAMAGFAFLCNERSVVLGPAYAGALFWSRGWSWLRRKESYLAVGVFCLVISPSVYANVAGSRTDLGVGYAEHLSRAGNVGINRHHILFFGRDAVAFLYDLLGRKLHDNASEYPAMNGLFGALLLSVVALCWRRFRLQDAGGKLFLSVFTVVMLFFSLVRPGAVPPGLDPVAWFWVDLTLPAAALLSAPVLSRRTGIVRKALLTLAGLALLCAGYAVWGGRLPLQRVAAAAVPEVLWPADGRLHEVQILFHACAICGPAPEAELVEILAHGGAKSSDVEGADPGTADRTFRLRAAEAGGPSRVYTAVYRVRDRFGIERVVRAEIFAPVLFDRPWPPRFWARPADRGED